MVKLIRSAQEFIACRAEEKGRAGFVPTMGNLHAGHISLLERALADCDVAYFSIFVNPKQFGPTEDFKEYPRTLEQDLELIKSCLNKYPGKSVIVFAPENSEEVFPASDDQTIAVSNFNNIIEGKLRPHHFDGVSTVVFKLFQIVKPHKAYFGLKDYQQYLVIRQMVKDLGMPIEIIGMPIIREPNGLALSSRNQYLSQDQKEEALILSRSLIKITQTIAGKKDNLLKAKKEIEGLMTDSRWNYLEIRDAYSLSEDVKNSSRITLVAVFQLGSTRLLDNMQQEIE